MKTSIALLGTATMSMAAWILGQIEGIDPEQLQGLSAMALIALLIDRVLPYIFRLAGKSTIVSPEVAKLKQQCDEQAAELHRQQDARFASLEKHLDDVHGDVRRLQADHLDHIEMHCSQSTDSMRPPPTE